MSEEIKVTEKDETEGHLMENIEVPVIKVGDIVKGSIVSLHDKYALIDINYKFNGIIPISEISSVFYENIADAVQVGQEVECQVISVDDEKESMRLSKKAIDKDKAWEKIVELQASNSSFDVKIVDAVKGGLVVDLGLRGFIPASQVSYEFVEDLSGYKGQTLAVKVKEVDAENKKVILSHRAVLDELKQQEKAKFITTLEVGQEFTGTVDRIATFGVFVNIGPIDGLVHISELSWDHIEKPESVVQIGDAIKVKIIKIDEQLQKVSLSAKALLQQPWEVAAQSIQEGSVVQGIVKRISTFGAFVEIATGVEGLVHISQIAHQHIKSPHEVLKVGQEVQIKVLQFDVENKKASLSIKELLEKPLDLESELEADRAQIEANSAKQSLTQNLGELFGAQLSKIRK
jgi:small subunit ribosomal protein S1